MLGTLPKKTTGKCGNFSQVGDPPYPLFGNFFPILPFIFGRSHMLKTVKIWKWNSGRPPPPFFQNSPIFPFFLGATSLNMFEYPVNRKGFKISSTSTPIFAFSAKNLRKLRKWRILKSRISDFIIYDMTNSTYRPIGLSDIKRKELLAYK